MFFFNYTKNAFFFVGVIQFVFGRTVIYKIHQTAYSFKVYKTLKGYGCTNQMFDC